MMITSFLAIIAALLGTHGIVLAQGKGSSRLGSDLLMNDKSFIHTLNYDASAQSFWMSQPIYSSQSTQIYRHSMMNLKSKYPSKSLSVHNSDRDAASEMSSGLLSLYSSQSAQITGQSRSLHSFNRVGTSSSSSWDISGGGEGGGGSHLHNSNSLAASTSKSWGLLSIYSAQSAQISGQSLGMHSFMQSYSSPGEEFIGTPISYQFNFNASDSNNALRFRNSFRSDTFHACSNIKMSVCNSTISYFEGDTYFVLYDGALNVPVTASDDACGYGSEIDYKFPQCGVFYFVAGCYADESCSGRVGITYYSDGNIPTNAPTPLSVPSYSIGFKSWRHASELSAPRHSIGSLSWKYSDISVNSGSIGSGAVYSSINLNSGSAYSGNFGWSSEYDSSAFNSRVSPFSSTHSYSYSYSFSISTAFSHKYCLSHIWYSSGYTASITTPLSNFEESLSKKVDANRRILNQAMDINSYLTANAISDIGGEKIADVAISVPSSASTEFVPSLWAAAPLDSPLTGSLNSVAVSSNGDKIIVGAKYGYLYESNDAGASFQRIEDREIYDVLDNSGRMSWSSIAMSHDGNSIIAATRVSHSIHNGGRGDFTGFLYVFRTLVENGLNFERTSRWEIENDPVVYDKSRAWDKVAISGDGHTVAAVDSANGLYIKRGGKMWKHIYVASAVYWTSISMSRFGHEMVASTRYFLYISLDGGMSWRRQNNAVIGGSKSWVSVAMSDDGRKIGAIDEPGFIYFTEDGNYWKPLMNSALPGVPTPWSDFAMDRDGRNMIAVSARDEEGVISGFIYISKDYGHNWQLVQDNDFPQDASAAANWISAAVSGDGLKMVAMTKKHAFIATMGSSFQLPTIFPTPVPSYSHNSGSVAMFGSVGISGRFENSFFSAPSYSIAHISGRYSGFYANSGNSGSGFVRISHFFDSAYPTVVPTSTPTSAPTPKPTPLPSRRPSRFPTLDPSKRPTLAPTTSPTPEEGAPTYSPTSFMPSSVPTLQPTIDLNTTASNEILTEFKSTYDPIAGKSGFNYGYAKYKGVVNSKRKCNDWNYFMKVGTTLPFRFLYFKSITAKYHEFDPTDNSKSVLVYDQNVTCSSKKEVSKLVALLSSPNSAIEDVNVVICARIAWVVYRTDTDSKALCAGSSCSFESIYERDWEAEDSTYLNPCMEIGFKESHYSILELETGILTLHPEFGHPLVATPFRTKINVDVNATKPGTVYCAALSRKPASTSVIKANGQEAIIENPGVVSVVISKLVPATDYKVYCYTQALSGESMPLEIALKSQLNVTTDCCRLISFTAFTSKVLEYNLNSSGLSPLVAYNFALDSIPTEQVNVTVSVETLQSCSMTLVPGITPKIIVAPFYFSFGPDSLGLTNSFIIKDSNPGCFKLSLISSSAVYTGDSKLVDVLSTTTPPDPPLLSSVTFSDDGRKLFVTFDTATNQGIDLKLPGIFPCDKILIFIGSSISNCIWTTSKTITAYLVYDPIMSTDIGVAVSIKSGVLKPKCSVRINATKCLAQDSSNTVYIQASLSPLSPSVAISSSATVSACDTIIIDPTNSRGGAGRPWTSIQWAVTSSDGKQRNTALSMETLLNTFKSTDDLVTIPNDVINNSPGKYDISLQLTNFLGVTSKSLISVDVIDNPSIPKVSIAGPSVISINRPDILNVFAVGSVPSCGASAPTVLPKLLYNWNIYKGTSTVPLSLKTISLDARYFKLDSFSLDAGQTYTVVCVVDNNGYTSAATVIVEVGQLGVQAEILGGASRTVTFKDGGAVLDASSSYSSDYPNDISILNFDWYCIDRTPSNYGGACKISSSSPVDEPWTNMVAFNKGGANPLILDPTVEQTVFELRVFVSNSFGAQSEATSLITIVNTDIPTVAFDSTQKKFNSDSKIILTGVIDTKNIAKVFSEWKCLEIDNSTFADITLTPLDNVYPARGSPSLYQLALKANVLTPGLTYSFTLGGGFQTAHDSVSQYDIVINKAPENGGLQLKPLSGRALDTKFFFRAYGWQDDVDDYPLSYVMDYYSDDPSAASIVKPIGTLSYVYAFVGQGLESMNHSVTCRVQVMDIYQCASFSETQIQVLEAIVTTDGVDNLAAEAFAKSDAGAIGQITSAVAIAANTVDCTMSFKDQNVNSCADLNRNNCSSTARTCGPCKAGFLGMEGDSNTQCKNMNARRLTPLAKNGESCSHNSSCFSDLCVVDDEDNSVKFCAAPLKACPNDCKDSLGESRGKCVFEDYFKNPVGECYNGEDFCFARCNCNAGYMGSDCSLTPAEMDAKMKVRETSCVSVYQTLAIQDVSKDVIVARASTIAAMLKDLTQLTDVALNNCALALAETVIKYPYLAGQDSVSSIVATSASNVLAKGHDLDTDLVTKLKTALELMTIGAQSNLAIGESPKEFNTKNVKMSTQVLENPVGKDLTPPQTDLDKFNGVVPSKLVIGAMSDAADKPTAVGVMTGSSNRNVEIPAAQASRRRRLMDAVASSKTLKTDQISIQTTSYGGSGRRRLMSSQLDSVDRMAIASAATRSGQNRAGLIGWAGTYPTADSAVSFDLKVTLRNKQPVVYYVNQTNTSIVCPIGNYSVHDVACNGVVDQYVCPGDVFTVYNLTCIAKNLPVCQVSDGSAESFGASDECEVESYNDMETVCSCKMASNRRKLGSSSTSSSSKSFSSTDQEYVGNLLNSYSDLIPTDSIINAIRENIVIIACGTLIAFYIIGFFDSVYTDRKENIANFARNALKENKVTKDLKTFFNSMIPVELTRIRWIDIFLKKLYLHHDWASILLPYNSERDFRSTKWLIGMGKLLNFMFISTFMSYLYFNDDGHCQKITTKDACINAMSMDISNTVCHWNTASRECYFNNKIGSSFISVMVLTTFVILMAIPLDNLVLFLSYHVRDYLAEKLEKNPYIDKANRDTSYELHSLQTRIGTLYRAARLVKMKRNMDDSKPAVVEAELMLSKNVPLILEITKNDHKVYVNAADTRVNFSGDSFVNAKRIKYGEVDSIKEEIGSKIEVARIESNKIVTDLTSLDSDYDQEQYLLRSFLVNSLTGYKRFIADSFFFPRINYQHQRSDDIAATKFWQKVSIFVLPAYCIMAMGIIIVYGMKIGIKSTPAWFYCVMLSFAQDIFINQPMKIFMRYVAVASIVSKDMFVWFSVLRDRSKHIIMRHKGLMRGANDLIQHFNPACRAARKFPHLAASRLLMSMSDFDIPTSRILSVRDGFGEFAYELTINVFNYLGFFFFSLPMIIQNIFWDFFAIFSVNLLLIVLALLSIHVSIAFPIVFGLVIVATAVLLEVKNRSVWAKNANSSIIQPVDAEFLDRDVFELMTKKATSGGSLKVKEKPRPDDDFVLDLVKAKSMLKKKPSSKYVISVNDDDIENDHDLVSIQTDKFNSKDQGSLAEDLEDGIV